MQSLQLKCWTTLNDKRKAYIINYINFTFSYTNITVKKYVVFQI